LGDSIVRGIETGRYHPIYLNIFDRYTSHKYTPRIQERVNNNTMRLCFLQQNYCQVSRINHFGLCTLFHKIADKETGNTVLSSASLALKKTELSKPEHEDLMVSKKKTKTSEIDRQRVTAARAVAHSCQKRRLDDPSPRGLTTMLVTFYPYIDTSSWLGVRLATSLGILPSHWRPTQI